ncbi:hypothetical protein CEQ30_41060 [Nocardia brasiliensis]|nr:hypothetical protein CEQ30_41060 [Nocardia brasiliensis]
MGQLPVAGLLNSPCTEVPAGGAGVVGATGAGAGAGAGAGSGAGAAGSGAGAGCCAVVGAGSGAGPVTVPFGPGATTPGAFVSAGLAEWLAG